MLDTFIYLHLYMYNFGMKFKTRGGVCNIAFYWARFYWIILWQHLHVRDPVMVHYDFISIMGYIWWWWWCVVTYCYFDVYILVDVIDVFSWVCRTHDRLWMLMASMDFLGLRIESGSEFYFNWVFHFTHFWHMIDYSMIYVYGLLTWVLL